MIRIRLLRLAVAAAVLPAVPALAQTPEPASATSPNAAEQRLRRLYEAEWAWRREQFAQTEGRGPGAAADRLPSVTPEAWAARRAYWERALAELDGVHAMTDVTGFGLLGHALEMARGAGLRATLDFSALPLVDGVLELARGGCITGASGRNWNGYGADVTLASGIDPVMQAVLTDPQTSGGLLVACEAAAVDDVVRHFKQEGFAQAREIGGFQDGPAGVTVYQ